MRLASWIKAKSAQVDLFTGDVLSDVAEETDKAPALAPPPALRGVPLMLPIDLLCEDPNNPRTEFPEAEIDELAESIREHGILQPLVVSPADASGHWRIQHGAKRSRAARRAGLSEVPVVVHDAPADLYAQAAENQKRHGLTPLDLARLIRRRADAGDSNALIAKRMGIDQTTIAHHLALLDLPPELNEVMQAGRCTSPRTLYELKKLHHEQPQRVKALLAGNEEITRSAVNALGTESALAVPAHRRAQPSLIAQAEAACARVELALDRLAKAEPCVSNADLAALKQRVAKLGSRLA